MTDCQFIAFHGWGFAGSDWQDWKDKLSEYGTFQFYDRGYFTGPKEITLSSDSLTVLISHSFGLHFIEQSLFDQADLLIINSGFLYFHPYTAQYKRRSRLIIQEMINNLEVKPEEVLQEFYENSYAPQNFSGREIEDLNHKLLIDDLQKLQSSEMDTQLLKKVGKICILHGSDDRIVPKRKGREIYTQFGEKSRYFEVKGAGHALPFTHYQQCLDFIIPEIEELIKIKA